MSDNIIDIFKIKEDLHPELAMYLETDPFPMLRHPMVYCMFYSPEQNAFLNRQYQQKLNSHKTFLETSNWICYVNVYERPHRLQAFLEIESFLNDQEYWEILGDIWIDSENIWQNKDIWKHLLKSKRTKREFFMNEEERELFKNLPEKLTIYRGYIISKNKRGMSYTLNKKTAEWFANRFKSQRCAIDQKEIKKSEAFAYLTRRGEEEIIYL